MLTIIEYGKDGYDFPALIVLGCFDAIHLGHRELLKKAKLQAKINGLDLGVMMFRGGKGGDSGKLLYSFEERCAMLEQYKVKFVVAVDFNEEFMAIAPIDFLHNLEEKINVKAYMSGKDFRFGAQAKGKSSTLKSYAEDEENGVWYMSVKEVTDGNDKISTTLVKSYLSAGNAAKAGELLGGDFSVTGEVVKGAGRGTSVVGFPTVNIVYPEWKHEIKHGVYSVKCVVGDAEYSGVANFGNCPTFDDDRIALEVYLENFSGDIYGQIVTVKFAEFIRETQDFGSVEQLNKQLHSDVMVADGGPADEIAVSAGSEGALAEPTEESVVESAEDEGTAEATVEQSVADEEIGETLLEEHAEEGAAVETAIDELLTAEESVADEQTEAQMTNDENANVITEAATVVEEPAITAEESVSDEVKELPEAETEESVSEKIAEKAVEEVSVDEEVKVDEAPEEVITSENNTAEETVAEEIPQSEEKPVEIVSEEKVDGQPSAETKPDEKETENEPVKTATKKTKSKQTPEVIIVSKQQKPKSGNASTKKSTETGNKTTAKAATGAAAKTPAKANKDPVKKPAGTTAKAPAKTPAKASANTNTETTAKKQTKKPNAEVNVQLVEKKPKQKGTKEATSD